MKLCKHCRWSESVWREGVLSLYCRHPHVQDWTRDACDQWEREPGGDDEKSE